MLLPSSWAVTAAVCQARLGMPAWAAAGGCVRIGGGGWVGGWVGVGGCWCSGTSMAACGFIRPNVTTLQNGERLPCLPLVQQAASALNVGVTTLKKVGGLGLVWPWVFGLRPKPRASQGQA